MDKRKKIQTVKQLIAPEAINPPPIDDIIICDEAGTPVLSMKRGKLSQEEILLLQQKNNGNGIRKE
jgi:hypothetical protein